MIIQICVFKNIIIIQQILNKKHSLLPGFENEGLAWWNVSLDWQKNNPVNILVDRNKSN